jgi:hypothetical protein
VDHRRWRWSDVERLIAGDLQGIVGYGVARWRAVDLQGIGCNLSIFNLFIYLFIFLLNITPY